MRRDESDVEAANEKPQGQQTVSGMAASLGQSFAQALFRLSGAGGSGRAGGARKNESHRQAGQRHAEDAARPVEGVHEQLDIRRQHKLAERTTGGDNAERQGTVLVANRTADDRQHQGNTGRRRAHADQNTGRQSKFGRRFRIAHQGHTDRVENPAGEQNAQAAEAVGERPGERHQQAPYKVLQGNGEGELGSAPVMGDDQRFLEQAERLAHAGAETEDQAAGNGNDEKNRVHGWSLRGEYSRLISCVPIGPKRTTMTKKHAASLASAPNSADGQRWRLALKRSRTVHNNQCSQFHVTPIMIESRP